MASKLQVVETTSSGDDGAPPNLIRLSRASLRPAPETGEGENALFLSQDGREAVVSWQERSDLIYYRESRGEGWSGLRSLRLGEGLDLAKAREILAQRAHERGSR